MTIGIKLGQTWLPVDVYVDSGAAYTILHATIAEALGFDLLTGQRRYLRVGDGSIISAYVHATELQIGRERFEAPIGFAPRLGVGFNLLGREAVFSRFAVCFHEVAGTFSFET